MLLSALHRAGPLFALLLAAFAARATTLHGPADIAALTAASDVVVRAHVASVESHWGAGGEKSGAIFTTAELIPSEQWKGDAVGERLWVRAPGGVVGDLAQEVVGSAELRAGDEVVLFLRLRASAVTGAGAHPAIYEVSHWALGKFVIQPAASPAALGAAARDSSSPSGPRAVRDRSGVECVGCRADEADSFSLDELRAQVQAAAASAPGKVRP